jgi:hypothetical protein
MLVLACDEHTTAARAAPCRPIAQAGPSAATIAVAASVTIAVSIESGCPAPLVRNETPAVLQVDSVSLGLIRIVGRATGSGQVRVRSGVDTLVSALVSVTVTP